MSSVTASNGDANSSTSPNSPNSSAEVEELISLDKFLADISALEALAEEWPQEQRNAAVARGTAIDALNAEAFRRLIRSLQSHPEVSKMLREAATDELVYAVLRRHGILKPSLFEQVNDALDTIRPMLESHGGDVELVSVESEAVEVRFLGACDGCPASALTFYSGVKKAIQDHFPHIKEIKQVKGFGGGGSDTVHYQSPFANYKSGTWVYLAKLGEFGDGETRILEKGGHSLLVTKLADRVAVFENACAHMGLAMDGGEIEQGLITCPYHGFQYSLESGECLTAPEVQLQPHGARVVGDRIEVQFTG